MPRGTVMVVEDDRILARAIDIFLTKRGYDVVTFHNGVEAQEYLNRAKPDSAVLDIQLPDSDGWSIAKVCSDSGNVCRIPIIMMSVLTPDRRKMAEYGIHTYIQKPFDMSILINAVDEALGVEMANGQDN